MKHHIVFQILHNLTDIKPLSATCAVN